MEVRDGVWCIVGEDDIRFVSVKTQLVDPGESSAEFEKVGRDVVKISDNIIKIFIP